MIQKCHGSIKVKKDDGVSATSCRGYTYNIQELRHYNTCDNCQDADYSRHFLPVTFDSGILVVLTRVVAVDRHHQFK